MLARKDIVGERGSCWWERIMLVEKDHVGGKGSCGCCKMVYFCKNMIFCTRKIYFCTERTPVCPFATSIAANYMSSRRAPFPIKTSTGNRPYVKVTSKKYVVEVLLNLFPQQYYCCYHPKTTKIMGFSKNLPGAAPQNL